MIDERLHSVVEISSKLTNYYLHETSRNIL